MGLFSAVALLITLTALFAYANERTLRLPTPVGVMLGGLLTSLGLVLFAGTALRAWAESTLAGIPFNELFTQGMLSFLLFAGALHVNLADLAEERVPILVLATVGVVLSTLAVAGLTYPALRMIGFDLPIGAALLFGAVISPTDPIAVLSILRRAGVPKSLEALITGESLFNDGVGVVVFTIVLGLATHEATAPTSAGGVVGLFLLEAAGGLVFGLLLGWAAYLTLKSVDNYTVEVLITLAVVTGGYVLAQSIHTSGPIAMVVAGLLVGNHGRLFAMSDSTREHLDTFWEMIDEILNAVLFVLIGLEVMVVAFTPGHLAAAAIAIPVVLIARTASVGAPLAALRLGRSFPQGTVRLLTWGGLRGGVSVALALALPPGPSRDVVVFMTFAVVVFSIIGQGLTVAPLARRVVSRATAARTRRRGDAPRP
ncbi:MAG: cation:proton antiporter [Acidobacteriota bacterium]